jgi:hypothetical protein
MRYIKLLQRQIFKKYFKQKYSKTEIILTTGLTSIWLFAITNTNPKAIHPPYC